jgi:hypothetical protein
VYRHSADHFQETFMTFRPLVVAAAFLIAGIAPAAADNMSSGMTGTNSMSNTSTMSSEPMSTDHMATPKKHKKKTSHPMQGGSMAHSGAMNESMGSSDTMKGAAPSATH